jgi:putative PEP-CTERM system TPR-repeat lipoprotein
MLNTNVIRLVAAATTTALLVVLVPGCGGDSDRDLIAAAKTFLDKKDDKAAIIQLKSALQKNPQSGEARFLLGETLLKTGDAGAAVVELEKARDAKYSDDAVAPLLARALMMSGQPKKAIDLFENQSLAKPEAMAALKATIASAYLAQGKLEAGEAAVNASLRADPKNATARVFQARLTAGRGEIDPALDIVNSVIADQPSDLPARHLKGELLWIGKSDFDGAIKAFREVLAIEPTHIPANSALIALLLQKRDFEGFRQQVAHLKRVLPNHPTTLLYDTQLALVDQDLKRATDGAHQLLKIGAENATVQQLVGVIELQNGALYLAESHLNKALQLSPGLTFARRALAQTYLRSGQAGKALATLKPMLDRPQPSAEILAEAAEANLQLGNSTQAEVLFNQAIKANPADPRVRTALALSQLARGNVDAGFAQLESLAASDKSTYADMALISAKLRRNEPDAALKAVDRLQTKIPDKPLPHVLRGRILAERKDVAGARASFEKALAVDPVYFAAVAELASIDMNQGKPDEARKRFEALLAREPKNYRALLAVADIRQRSGTKPEEVTQLLIDAVKLNSGEVAVRLALVEQQLGRRQAKAALGSAQEGLLAFPDNAEMLDALGRASLAAGDTQQAIIAFKKLASAHPEMPLPYLRLAECYAIDKAYNSATQNLRKALEIDPKLLPAQQALVRIALAENRSADALNVARSLQKQRPTEAVGYLLETDIHASRREWEPAIASARTALERERSSRIAIRLHSLYSVAGRQPDADRFAAAWLKEMPRDAVLMTHLATVALERKDYATAEAHFRQVQALRPDDAVVLNNIAWVMVQQGKPGAVALADRANQLLPEQPLIMDTLASALAADKQWPKAIEWQQKAVDKVPDRAGYRLNLAKLLLDSGDRARARTELEVLAKLSSQVPAQVEAVQLLKKL